MGPFRLLYNFGKGLALIFDRVIDEFNATCFERGRRLSFKLYENVTTPSTKKKKMIVLAR